MKLHNQPLKGRVGRSKTFHIVSFNDEYIIVESDIYPKYHVLQYCILRNGIFYALQNNILNIRNNNHYAVDFEKSPINRKKGADHTSILTKYYRAIHESLILAYNNQIK